MQLSAAAPAASAWGAVLAALVHVLQGMRQQLPQVAEPPPPAQRAQIDTRAMLESHPQPCSVHEEK
eukprot:scaffold67237_cov17-Tisochrysis_lutea.AAC.1